MLLRANTIRTNYLYSLMQLEHNHSCHHHHHHPREKLLEHSYRLHHHRRHRLPCMLREHSQNHCHHRLQLHDSCTMKQQPWIKLTFSFYFCTVTKEELWFKNGSNGGLCLWLNYTKIQSET
ncbi:hypothetical protein V6Z11_A05G020400 [Gossypium hirsutum]